MKHGKIAQRQREFTKNPSMNSDTWQKLYDDVRSPQLHTAVVGFNVNLDRIITVTPALLQSPLLTRPELFEIRSRLLHSMQSCTAEEWFVTDRSRYQQFARVFSGTGSLVIGGQAGIAAVHLASIGVPDVLCITHSAGLDTKKILINAGVSVLDISPQRTDPPDTIHLVFEYPPGLVPVDEGVVPRNNRFIASPAGDPESALIRGNSEDSVISRVSSYSRVFLSGYQYLLLAREFALAADQILRMKKNAPQIRVHVECVSVTDDVVIGGFARYILPAADSIGLNEHELLLLLHHLYPQEPGYGLSKNLSPVQLVQGVLEVCRKSGLRRLHLHTFGYYVLVLKKDCAHPDISLNALLFASLTTADAAEGSSISLSPVGISALEQVEDAFGPPLSPGIFLADTHMIIVIPTIIAHAILKSSGLGDILSSTAFVADRF
jgi:ADP-dependent phosphofructokinase/glucokinase